jgi:thiol peroxidase
VLNIVPSLDTPTCEEQTTELSETNEGLDKQVELVTISMDLPFAQRRFSKDAKIGNVTFLSDYRGGSFGKGTGLLQKQSQLLARAVLVVDKENVIRHMQVVPDMSTLPDLQIAFKVARGLL